MDPLEKLAQQAPGLEFELPDGTPVIRLGLVATLYFREGYTTAVKEKIVECFERFYEEFETHLNWQVASRPQKLSRQQFERHRDAILCSEPNEQCEWHLSSARDAKEAGVYSLSVLGSYLAHGDKKRSYIKITFPCSSRNTQEDFTCYHKWLLFLCAQLNVEHGYGGLSLAMPYDYDQYMPIEYQLAERFSGLEVDSMPHSFKRELLDYVKGVNWYTVLGQTFVDRLGGEEIIRRSLAAAPNIEYFNYDNGLIIRAGEYPALGAQEDGLPRAYVAVNRVVKPVRIPNPDQLHSYSPYGDCFDEESTRQWYARFDQDESVAQPTRIAGGKSCSHSGYWFTPAKQHSRRYFQRGDILPVIEDSSWGGTFWYWADGDN
ncbi:hypothetical protein LCGC14_0443290 [marine sediment metagenome]|uniref:DUF3396 domain-containing protein n=1 Tax=marine sediment metagenome TaxID=412755 RepID=A0A0F9SJT7_9ZZZZ|nr:DUF3396 domain-containing protein [Halopseudomonas sabulinigri]